MKRILILVCLFNCMFQLNAQMKPYSFGEGIRYNSPDTSFSIKGAFRFQSLFVNQWSVTDDDLNDIGNRNSNFLIRRARLKFDGFAFSPKLKYKFELGLSNRDINISNEAYFGAGANIVLDAYLDWNFYGGFTLRVGQGKLPGNRERVISSGNLQFVNRSILNSRFTLDRDVGLSLIYDKIVGDQFGIKLIGVLSQGEGRNVTAGNLGGNQYTFRSEFYPFGKFHKKGDYVSSAVYREKKPKLAIGFTIDQNTNAGRSRGNLGDFLPNEAMLETLYSGFIDLMFKYQGLSLMGEYTIRNTKDGSAAYFDNENQILLGHYYTGAALNFQAGYMFKNNIEVAGRYTKLAPTNNSVGFDENHYFLALSKFIVGHKLKVQTDLGYMQKEFTDDGLMWRVQFDFHL